MVLVSQIEPSSTLRYISGCDCVVYFRAEGRECLDPFQDHPGFSLENGNVGTSLGALHMGINDSESKP